jgi:hypothetical protein
MYKTTGICWTYKYTSHPYTMGTPHPSLMMEAEIVFKMLKLYLCDVAYHTRVFHLRKLCLNPSYTVGRRLFILKLAVKLPSIFNKYTNVLQTNSELTHLYGFTKHVSLTFSHKISPIMRMTPLSLISLLTWRALKPHKCKSSVTHLLLRNIHIITFYSLLN